MAEPIVPDKVYREAAHARALAMVSTADQESVDRYVKRMLPLAHFRAAVEVAYRAGWNESHRAIATVLRSLDSDHVIELVKFIVAGPDRPTSNGQLVVRLLADIANKLEMSEDTDG